ncbi:MAG TPA: sulfur carrier protein ThiS [Phycisphaerae bacterium]|nr:sulfur carrier protein ThiS [Phycisphaerae bacterium]
MATIRATINGEERELSAGLTMTGLLAELELAPVRVAVEVNRELVSRRDFGETTIRDGDHIEIVTFVGGG